MTVYVSYTENGTSSNLTEAYTVQNTTQSAGVTIYNVVLDANVSSSGQEVVAQFAYASNESVLSLSFDGTSMSPSEGAIAISLMSGFAFELAFTNQFNLNLLTSTYLTKVNTTQVTLGPTTLSVTNYKPSSLPFTYSYCGTSAVLTQFELQYGNVPNSHFGSLLTYLVLQGTISGAQENILLELKSITVASSS